MDNEHETETPTMAEVEADKTPVAPTQIVKDRDGHVIGEFPAKPVDNLRLTAKQFALARGAHAEHAGAFLAHALQTAPGARKTVAEWQPIWDAFFVKPAAR
jgi:hypothetical protein